MSWTQAQLDVCQEAFYLLRQDMDVPTVAAADTDASPEWKKCKHAWTVAIADILGAHGWRFTAGLSDASDVSQWPAGARGALVYCLARELAIPIAGRMADMEAMDRLYRDKLMKARIKDLSDGIDDMCDNAVVPFVFATTGENQMTGTQRTKTLFKFALGASMVAKVGGTVSAVTVRTHRESTDSNPYQLVLFALSGSTHTFLAGSKNTVTPSTPGSLVTWQFDDVEVPTGAVLVCRLLLGYIGSQSELADVFGTNPDAAVATEANPDASISFTFPVQLSPTISNTEFSADASDFAYWDTTADNRHPGITAAARLYSYEARATSLQATAQKVMRRVFPFIAAGDGSHIPYSVEAFANSVNATSLDAENEVRRTIGTNALDALSMSAAEALATAKVAPVVGLDTNFAQLRLQEYQAKIKEWRKVRFDDAVAGTSDPVRREALSILRSALSSSDAVPRNVTEMLDSLDAMETQARREVLTSHDWSFAETEYVCDTAWTDSPDPVFRHRVALPKSCLMVSACYGEDGKVVQWKQRGREIHAKERVVRIVYIKDVTDLSAWHPKAQRAFALRLAADLAKRADTNANARAMQESLYRDALEEARACDARSANTPDEAYGDNEIADIMLYGRR